MPRKSHIVLDLTDADPSDDKIILEDKIPIPTRFRDLTSKYPFTKMKLGQSFFVPGEPIATCRRLCQAVVNFKRKEKNGKEFVVRSRNKSQPEHVNAMKEVGARVWRVK